MALRQPVVAAFVVFALVLMRVDSSACHTLKGFVACLDCNRHEDLSGIKVVVKCRQARKMSMATTEADGSFETQLPTEVSASTSKPSFNCMAKLVGGPTQLYVSRNSMLSNIVSPDHDHHFFTVSSPLSFYTSCPSSQKDSGSCGPQTPETGSSKTVDLPLPREWGFAPSSYYVPFFPIIGIP